MKGLAMLALLSTTALMPVAATAQNQPAPANQQSPAAQPGKPVSANEFVQKAANTNMFEIQSSQLALDKAANDQPLKNFAQRMIHDHTAATDKLKAAAQTITVPTSLDQEHQQMLSQLQGASGSDFNRRYVTMQVKGHQDAVQLFEQYAQNGDNNSLKQFAQNTVPTLRDHLQAITKIRNDMFGPDRTTQGQDNNQQSAQNNGQGEASRIVVRQPSPTVQVQQASPEVTVHQAQPQVTVRQQQPEIIVRQPQPTVRVDIPQPEIIVRMPKPDVNVAMAQPQVDVRQPQPQVQVVQPQQPPKVNVQREQPQVMVQAATGQPDVQLQREGQPNVRYERTGQPNVVVNQPQGQPQVKFEQMADDKGQPNQATAQGNQQQAHATQLTAQERQRAEQRLGYDVNATATANVGNPKTKTVTIKQLDDMDVYNAKGEKLGDVGQVILDPQSNKKFVVVEHGGFLGIGEDKVAFPLDRFWMKGDRLVIRGVTEQDIENMGNYRDQVRNYRRLADNDRTDLRLWQ